MMPPKDAGYKCAVGQTQLTGSQMDYSVQVPCNTQAERAQQKTQNQIFTIHKQNSNWLPNNSDLPPVAVWQI